MDVMLLDARHLMKNECIDYIVSTQIIELIISSKRFVALMENTFGYGAPYVVVNY